MKIETINSHTCSLVMNHWLLRVIGIVFFLFGIGAFIDIMKEQQIACHEKQPNHAAQCTLHSDFFGFFSSNIPLGKLNSAVVIIDRSSGKNKGTIYSMQLLTDSGRINFGDKSGSSGDNKNFAVNAINQYINNSSEKTFPIPDTGPWWIFLATGAMSVVGAMLILMPSTTVIFNRASQTVLIQKKGIFKKAEDIAFLFSDIEKIIIEESKSSKGTPTYRLALTLKNKPAFPFVTFYDSNYLKKKKAALQLNKFMGLDA